MSVTVNVHDAKTNFSRLLSRVCEGEEVVIARAGKPIARLVPIGKGTRQRIPGSAKRKIALAGNFEEPLPATLLREFEK